jgi:hypothetical protein
MKVLSGWKEIANHMRQGERTVKRWEQFGLPVHRVGEAQKGPVFAFVEEVEKWEKTTGTQNADVIQKLQIKVKSLQAEVAVAKTRESKVKAQPESKSTSASLSFCPNQNSEKRDHPSPKVFSLPISNDLRGLH